MRGDGHETENAIYSNIETNFKIESKLLKSLDFLTDNIDDINKVIQDILETNPFRIKIIKEL